MRVMVRDSVRVGVRGVILAGTSPFEFEKNPSILRCFEARLGPLSSRSSYALQRVQVESSTFTLDVQVGRPAVKREGGGLKLLPGLAR